MGHSKLLGVEKHELIPKGVVPSVSPWLLHGLEHRLRRLK
jgi:hypothetical protein